MSWKWTRKYFSSEATSLFNSDMVMLCWSTWSSGSGYGVPHSYARMQAFIGKYKWIYKNRRMNEEVCPRLPWNSLRLSRTGVVLTRQAIHKHSFWVRLKYWQIRTDPHMHTQICVHREANIHTNRRTSHTSTVPRHTGANTLHASMHGCTPDPFPPTSLWLTGNHCIHLPFKRLFSGCQNLIWFRIIISYGKRDSFGEVKETGEPRGFPQSHGQNNSTLTVKLKTLELWGARTLVSVSINSTVLLEII